MWAAIINPFGRILVLAGVATALAGQTIGLRREGRTVTVWYSELALGSFVYGLDKSVQPLTPGESGSGEEAAPRPDAQTIK